MNNSFNGRLGGSKVTSIPTQNKEMSELNREKVVSTLTLKYRSRWGVWEAIREIFTNSIDEVGDLPKMHTEDDVCIIQDEGEGMSKRQFLLLGISEKKGTEKIGQFGEGLKIGLVILLREGCSIVVKSQDWRCEVTTDTIEGEPVVAYIFDELESPIRGVRYEIAGLDTRDVKNMIADRFLPKESEHYVLTSARYGKIITGPFVGKLYHRGVWVQDTHKKSVFGYDLFNMKLGTDREYADYYSIGYEMGNLFEQLQDEEAIDTILDAWQKDTLEAEARYMNLNPTWSKVFIKKYGDNAVVSHDSELRGKVSYEGGKLVRLQNAELVNALWCMGIFSAEAYIHKEQKKRAGIDYKFFDEISKRKQKNVKIAFGIVQNLGMFRNTFRKMVEDGAIRFFNSNLNDGRAFGEKGGNNIYLPLDCIHDPVLVAKKIIHELIHVEYNADDLSEAMQCLQYEAIEKLMRYTINYLSLKSLEMSV